MMTTLLEETCKVDEPCEGKDYAAMISRVAAECQAVIIRRDGNDIAAIIPLEHLERLRDALAMEEAERIAKTIDWDQVRKTCRPPQGWFDGEEPKPF
jgi:hypothetical protein